MPALDLTLNPSPLFKTLWLTLLSGAILSIFCSHLPYYIQFFLGVAVLVYGRAVWRSQVVRTSKEALRTLRIEAGPRFSLEAVSGRRQEVLRLEGGTRFSLMTVLRFQVAGHIRQEVIFRDAVSRDAYRRLLVILNQY